MTNKNFSRAIRKLSGFTLVELIVVIAIVATLSAVGFVSFQGATGSARDAARKTDLASIRTALELVFNETGSYPEPAAKSSSNAWGWVNSIAQETNTITVTNVGGSNQIASVTGAGGGNICIEGFSNCNTNFTTHSYTIGGDSYRAMIGKKGVLPTDNSSLSKYMQKIPSDPKVGNIKLSDQRSFEEAAGVGRYIYAVTEASKNSTAWIDLRKHYQLAATLENDGNPMTYIIGNYSPISAAFGGNATAMSGNGLEGQSGSYTAPASLIGGISANGNSDAGGRKMLVDKDVKNLDCAASTDSTCNIPYWVENF